MFFGLFKTKSEKAMENALKNGEAIVIDVRTRGEFQGGHVAASINIPLNELGDNVAKIKKMNKTIVLCCASGMRSSQAAGFLRGEGVENVFNGGSWVSVRGMLD
jgi:phage shock protein E